MMWVVLLVLTACNDGLDDLTGKYPTPESYTFNTVASSSVEKQDALRLFAVRFTNASGDELSITFVGSSYYLQAAAFSEATATEAKSGNYILGANYTSFKKVGASSAVAVDNGTLTVTKDGDNYTISGVLWMADNSVIEVSCTGTIVYEADANAEPIALTKVLGTLYNYYYYQMPTVTVQLGTADVDASYDAATYSMVYTGTGNYLAIDFYTPDGYLYPGTYTPADAASVAEGNYVKGYDTTYDWGGGTVDLTNLSTCWWTVDNGTTSGVHIETGDIVVEKNDNIYTITLNNGDIYAKFTGEIAGVTPPSTDDDDDDEGDDSGSSEGGSYTMDKVYYAVAANGTTTLKFSKDVTVTLADYQTTWTDSYVGDGVILSLDLKTSTGTSLEAGTYTIADNTTATTGNFIAGYDTTMEYGGVSYPQYNWGSCWFTVTSGTLTGKHIKTGTVVIATAESGSGYTITFDGTLDDTNSTAIKASYTGEINVTSYSY